MKQVIQLDDNGYFTGVTVADLSPLEAGVYLMPAGTVDAEAPAIPEAHVAKWNGAWVYEAIPEPVVEPEAAPPVPTYADNRAAAYPPMFDYLDGIVKDDTAQVDAYIAACVAVKLQFPKPE
tara:strand:- start:76 stop:438 length:363 start_codon:yes stop_codon:yes gene_type:complete